MTDEELTELLIHPRLKATVDRLVHTKLVQLGLAKTGYQLAVEQSETRRNEDKPRRRSIKEQAAEEGWVAVTALPPLLGIRYQDVLWLRKNGHLRRVAHGYVDAEDVERLKAALEAGEVQPPRKGERRPRTDAPRAEEPIFRLPPDLITIPMAAKAMGLSRSRMSQLISEHKVPKQRRRVTSISHVPIVVVDRAALEAALGRKLS